MNRFDNEDKIISQFQEVNDNEVKPNMDTVHEGEMIAGKPHLFFWDENFVNVFLHSGIDYLIWYAPYKLLRTSQGIFELPKVVMFDCKTGNYDNLIKYNEERICSSEL